MRPSPPLHCASPRMASAAARSCSPSKKRSTPPCASTQVCCFLPVPRRPARIVCGGHIALIGLADPHAPIVLTHIACPTPLASSPPKTPSLTEIRFTRVAPRCRCVSLEQPCPAALSDMLDGTVLAVRSPIHCHSCMRTLTAPPYLAHRPARLVRRCHFSLKRPAPIPLQLESTPSQSTHSAAWNTARALGRVCAPGRRLLH